MANPQQLFKNPFTLNNPSILKKGIEKNRIEKNRRGYKKRLQKSVTKGYKR